MTDIRPTVGSDRDTWGSKLLTWLGGSVNTDGTLKATAAAAALPSAVDSSGVLLPAAVRTALGGSRSVVTASGDTTGVTDTDTILAVIAAGKDPDLIRGSTYWIDKEINISTAGGTLWGNGATFKRIPQVVTTTATTITTGVTTAITVASTTGMRVGQQYVCENGGTYDATSRIILSIVGSVVTFTTAIGINASGTTNVRLAYNVVRQNGSNCTVRELFINGNRSNWTWARWENCSAIYIGGSDTLTEHCNISEAPGEGIQAGDGSNQRCFSNTLNNINGNGIHYGASVANIAGRIEGNSITNVNLDTTVGHANGGIVLSNLSADYFVGFNYIKGTTLSGIGSIDSNGNSDITILGNEIRNCGKAIDGHNATNGNVANNVLIIGNRIYSSGYLEIFSFDASATRPSRWLIANNLFVDTYLNIRQSAYVTVTGNDILMNDTTSDCVLITNAYQISVTDNQIQGGNSAVRVTGGNPQNDIRIGENRLSGQHTFGIIHSSGGALGANISFENNAIINDATAVAASYEGIRCQVGDLVTGNKIQLVAGLRGIYVAAGTKGWVSQNWVRGATTSIKIEAGAVSWLISYNVTDGAVSDAGTTTTLTSNTTI